MIDGISDDRKIALSKLEHIMLGTVNKRVSGFHCNIDCNNDTKVEIYGKPKYSSNGIRRYNGEKRIFEASVKSKPKKTKIVYKKDKSSFFCQE